MKIRSLFFLSVYTLCALISTVIVVACDDKDDNAPSLTFPETQIINSVAGNTHQLTFEAQEAWKLSSTAVWCKFATDNGTQLSTAGQAGTNTVTLSITDEGMSNDEASVAQLMLFMQGQQGTLAQVTRSAAGYTLQVYDANGKETDIITAGYGEYSTFYVKANFPFAVTSLPEWAELSGTSLVGAAGEMTESGILSYGKSECTGSLLIQDMYGKAAFNIQVVYGGMNHDAIIIEQPDGNAWNWTVSADGQTWTHAGNTYGDHVTCTVTTYNDDYEVVYVEEADKQFTINQAQWIHLDKKTGRITVDATEETRTGYIFAFPRDIYEKIKDNLTAALVEGDALTYNYLQNNLVICIKQEEPKTDEPTYSDEVGFIAISFDQNWDMVETKCYRITDKTILDHCETAIGTREVFLLDYRSTRYGGGFDQVCPYPYLSDYNDWDHDLCFFANYDGTRITEFEPEPGFADTETPNFWYIMGCSNSEVPIFLVLLNKDRSVMKALLIHTKE